MGFFSWLTSDTGRSIPNHYSNRPTFKVHMITEDGQVFTEDNYEGYGEFGGKDFYELLAELNGKTNRNEGIDIAFKNNPSGDYNRTFKMPKIVENLPSDIVKDWDSIPYPESCPDQGFFYCDRYTWDDDD